MLVSSSATIQTAAGDVGDNDEPLVPLIPWNGEEQSSVDAAPANVCYAQPQRLPPSPSSLVLTTCMGVSLSIFLLLGEEQWFVYPAIFVAIVVLSATIRKEFPNVCYAQSLRLPPSLNSLYETTGNALFIGIILAALLRSLLNAPIFFFLTCFAVCCLVYCITSRNPVREQQRVNAVDFHASWVLTAVSSGHVAIWDTKTILNDNDSNSNEVTADDDDDDIESSNIEKKKKPLAVVPVGDKSPVRCAKFVERYHWIVTASDDGKIRVYHLHSFRLLQEFEAHDDFIRHLEVHPTLPYLLSASDDMKVICWDMEYNFARRRVYEAHIHYVMQVKIHPGDTNMFASASLDRTMKVWNLEQEDASSPLYTLEFGHTRGITCLEWCQTPGNNNNSKQSYYLISGSEDQTVKVWDLATKAVIHSLEGHSHNVTAVLCHPTLPLLITAAEDGECRVWNATTYKEVSSFIDTNSGAARTLVAAPGKNTLAIGCDQGCLFVNLQSDDTEFRSGLEVTHQPILTIEGSIKNTYIIQTPQPHDE